MRTTIGIALLALVVAGSACKGKKSDKNANSNAATAASNANAKDDGPRPGDVPPPPDVAAAPADAKKSPKGVSYKVLTPGKGEKKPSINDTVVVNFTGWLPTGRMYDTSNKKKAPFRRRVGMTMPGWKDVLPLMSVGEKVRMWIPEELAYEGKPGHPKGMMVFEVELLEVVDGLPVPEDVAAAPADAKKTASGLAYKVLAATKDKKAKKPRAWDQVSAHYSGWTTDGVMFDSSIERGRPSDFPLNRVIKGWQEGIPLMKVGDKFRFWIPADLAYGDNPGGGKPKGLLVFDVELHAVKELPKPPPPPPTPKDVGKAPADAQKTELGVFYKVLKKGKGKEKPTKNSTAQLHIIAWTADGKLISNTYEAGKPRPFPLNHVFPGLADAVGTMSKGQKSRFWIPEELGTKHPQAPKGTITYDIELVDFSGNMGMKPGALKPGATAPGATPHSPKKDEAPKPPAGK
jgi:peptidylprolyl isomerase